MSDKFERSPGVDPFYAEIFLAVARGMVSRPKDLDAYVSADLDDDRLFTVVAQAQATDHGSLIGKFSAHVLAFASILKAASARRGEICNLRIEEGFGVKVPTKTILLDPTWDRDAEVCLLVDRFSSACFPGMRGARIRTERGQTIVTVESNAGLAEEYLTNLQTLFKAWGRQQGRTIRIESEITPDRKGRTVRLERA